MHKLTLAVLLALALVVGFAQAHSVYKWVDDQGNVHYSDHPHPGAEKVRLPKTQTYAPPSTSGMPAPPPLPPAAPAASYTQFTIASPGSQASLWYTDEVTVSVNVSPELKSGDTITYHLDSQSLGPTQATSVTFKNIPRGEHTASATLNAANGASMSAGPVTFYVKQKTILGPKPPL
ncbi:MAG: DUF4124 domain-containing protein [Gammaproteobacteria bacterium]